MLRFRPPNAIKVCEEKKNDAQKYRLGISQDLDLNVSALGLPE